MEIKYNVQVPPKKSFNGGAKSEEVKAIEDFLTSGNVKNIAIQKLVGHHYRRRVPPLFRDTYCYDAVLQGSELFGGSTQNWSLSYRTQV